MTKELTVVITTKTTTRVFKACEVISDQLHHRLTNNLESLNVLQLLDRLKGDKKNLTKTIGTDCLVCDWLSEVIEFVDSFVDEFVNLRYHYA